MAKRAKIHDPRHFLFDNNCCSAIFIFYFMKFGSMFKDSGTQTDTKDEDKRDLQLKAKILENTIFFIGISFIM